MTKKPKDKRIACLDIHSALYLRTKGDIYPGGDIGSMYELVDWAREAGFGLIQMNPIQDTGLIPCPYMGVSIFSYNPIFLDVKKLPANAELQSIKDKYSKYLKKEKTLIDYRHLYRFKKELLAAYAKQEMQVNGLNARTVDKNILSYALFAVLKERFKTSWRFWPKTYREGDVKKILEQYPELIPEVEVVLVGQKILEQQWLDLVAYARKKRVVLMMDKPIYPIHNSAEVWANQQLFYLRSNGKLKFGSGANHPKDPFGPQYWGHAVYKFKEEPDKVITYLFSSIEHLSKISRVIRLDHALALVWKYYIVNPKTKFGRHIVPLRDRFFLPLLERFPHVYFIAEDAGYINKKLVDRPLNRYRIPGMRCPQWTVFKRYTEFSKFPKNCLAFTSNHDTESLPAWWGQTKKRTRKIFFDQIEGKTIIHDHWSIVRLLFDSRANIASISLRDIADDRRRYNLPGTIKPQNWRLRSKVLLDEMDRDKIKSIIRDSQRD